MLRWDNAGVGLAPNPIWLVSLREEKNLDPDVHRGKNDMKTHGQKMTMWRWRQNLIFATTGHIEHFGLPDSERGKNGSSPRSFKRRMALSTSWFWNSRLQNYKRINSHSFKSLGL